MRTVARRCPRNPRAPRTFPQTPMTTRTISNAETSGPRHWRRKANFPRLAPLARPPLHSEAVAKEMRESTRTFEQKTWSEGRSSRLPRSPSPRPFRSPWSHISSFPLRRTRQLDLHAVVGTMAEGNVVLKEGRRLVAIRGTLRHDATQAFHAGFHNRTMEASMCASTSLPSPRSPLEARLDGNFDTTKTSSRRRLRIGGLRRSQPLLSPPHLPKPLTSLVLGGRVTTSLVLLHLSLFSFLSLLHFSSTFLPQFHL